MYDFIAELFVDKRSEKPLYKTHIWGIPGDEETIKRLGFSEDPESMPMYTDYLKEMRPNELTRMCSLEDNPELASILLEGNQCRKVILHAYQTEVDMELGCQFGIEDCLWATFSGNKEDSRVRISNMYYPPVVDLPLRCFKEKMGVLTLFEVMEKLQKRYASAWPEELQNIQEEYSSGLNRAIELVSYAFADDLDLDGNPQLLHMSAVSCAGANDDERLVGMLHDLVEDTDWTFEKLQMEGFPERTINSLKLLTHDKETPYMDYVRNICESGDKVAIAVKINDLNHNLKRGRAGGHWQHVAKHEKALAFIQEFIENSKKDEQR